MKILLIGPGMGLPIPPVGWGGIEKVIAKHSCELRNRGHVVEIINEQNKNLLLSTIESFKPDVIHSHQEWNNQFLIDAKIPFIFTSHMSSWVRNWDRVKSLLTGCTLSMPFEQMGKRLHSEGYTKHWPIWNGADRELFKPSDKILGMCLAVGKDEARKKFPEIIKYTQCTEGFNLTLVGPGNEKYKGEAKVTVLSNLPEETIAALMGKAEVFMHLSEEEADALVVKEAMLSGCRLVLSDYCRETLGITKEQCLDVSFCRALALRKFTWQRAVDNLEQGYFYYLESVK